MLDDTNVWAQATPPPSHHEEEAVELLLGSPTPATSDLPVFGNAATVPFTFGLFQVSIYDIQVAI